MAHDASLVVATGLGKRFGRTPALEGFGLSLQRGCCTALVGRNGAGKSTALKLILGLLRPSEGRVAVLGHDPIRDPVAVRLRTGIVLDRVEAFGWLRARDVLDVAASVHPRWKPAECRRLVERFELPLDTTVRRLSRGQAAQLSFAVALSSEPDLLVLDEPTSGLDPVVRHLFVDEVRRAVERRGAGVLFTSHVMSDVDGAADEVLVLENGRLIAQGSPRDLGRRWVRVSFLFDAPPPPDVVVPGASRVHRGVRELVATFPGEAPDEAGLARTLGARDARRVEVGFDDVFLELQREQGRVTP